MNTVKIKDREDDDFEFLSQEYRKELYKTVFLGKDKNFKFEKIRKAVDRFYGKNKIYNYPLDSKSNTYETTVAGMPFAKSMIKLLGEKAKKDSAKVEQYTISTMPKNYSKYSLLDIWHNITEFDENALTKFGKEKLNLENRVKKNNEEAYEVSPLVEIKNTVPQGYGNLSQYVLRKIIPLLKDGYLYNDAVLLANIPEALGEEFEENKHKIVFLLEQANQNYRERKRIITIVNNLVEEYKGEVEAFHNGEDNNLFAYKDFNYVLEDSDKNAVERACICDFGEQGWQRFENKAELINQVGLEYQEFFFDIEGAFRRFENLQDIFEKQLALNGIYLSKAIYHHSNLKNIYGSTIKYRNTNFDILPLAQQSSIKNPMFNKAMSVLRKLVNQLIIEGKVDADTEVIVEIARELNDNNKRIAIEKFQKQRETKRSKIREFLEEYKTKEKPTLNIEDSIRQFELWYE